MDAAAGVVGLTSVTLTFGFNETEVPLVPFRPFVPDRPAGPIGPRTFQTTAREPRGHLACSVRTRVLLLAHAWTWVLVDAATAYPPPARARPAATPTMVCRGRGLIIAAF